MDPLRRRLSVRADLVKSEALNSKNRVDAALYRELLGVSPLPLIGSALASALLGIGLWNPANSLLVIGWVALVFAMIALRAVVSLRSRRTLAARGYTRSRARVYGLSVGLSGVAWGIGGLFVHGANPLALTLIVIALQSMLMGGVVTLSILPAAFLAFSVPAILPMVIVLVYDGGKIEIILAVYNFLLLGLMTGIAMRVHRSLRRTWQLTFEKEDLVAELTAARDGMSILAETDGLTGLANRRRFNQALEAEFSRSRRSGLPLSLIILDVDYFKNYNDSYGHVAGDSTLQRIGNVLKESCNRASDVVARYGGEEFAAILPETDQHDAAVLAERIRARTEALAIAHTGSHIADHVTVSVGVITSGGERLESTRQLISMADEQLYRAKAQGRNVVVGPRQPVAVD